MKYGEIPENFKKQLRMEMNVNLNAPINKEWKKYLIEYTNDIDMLKVVEATGVGYHTLRRLRLGQTNVANDENRVALTQLAHMAVKNARKRKQKVVCDESQMTEKLPNIFDCI